jgi:hypothetical protein
MLSTGILFDFLIGFTEVLSGDGGVVATSCLHFLVTASIGTVGEGCRVCAFSEFRLTQSSTTGKIDDVDYSYAVSYQYDINGNITNKSDVGDYSYNAVNGGLLYVLLNALLHHET